MNDECTVRGTMWATTVRITPLDVAGTPQWTGSLTVQVSSPVLLTIADRRPAEPITSPPVVRAPRAVYLAALTVPHGHRDRMDLYHLGRCLRRPTAGTSLEAWSELDAGRWQYAALPWLRGRSLEDWPLEVDLGQDLCAAGPLREVGAHIWPPLCPLAEPSPIPPGTVFVVAETSVPPPPPGSPLTQTATVPRHRVAPRPGGGLGAPRRRTPT